jgi:hypothetical protein
MAGRITHREVEQRRQPRAKSGQAIRSSTSNDNFAHRVEELRSHDYNA